MRTPTAALLLLTFVTTPILGYGIGKRDSINPILRRSAHYGRAIDPVPVVSPPDTINDPTTSADSSSQPASSVPAFSLADPLVYLTAHNNIRSLHGADPLVWSEELESYAQEWAGRCVLRASGGAFGQFGENVLAGTGAFTAASAVSTWADTKSEYNPSSPAPNQWAQLVWKQTRRVGCSAAMCPRIIPGSGTAVVHVCFYDGPGNVNGHYSDNVQV
jgi:pathogenesis-related protein 1